MQTNQNKFLPLGIFPAAWEEALSKKQLIYTATILQKIF